MKFVDAFLNDRLDLGVVAARGDETGCHEDVSDDRFDVVGWRRRCISLCLGVLFFNDWFVGFASC